MKSPPLPNPTPHLSILPHQIPPCHVTALYVHVPFCLHKCHYCDFYSLPGQQPHRMNAFVDLLLAEADLWRLSPIGPLIRPQTIFIGGGTPTLLPLPAMRRLLLGIRERFDLSSLIEFTIEANPATITPDYAATLAQLAVTRLSFGAQSFHTPELSILQRQHAPADVADSIRIARNAGFNNLNLDLIYAIPTQNLQSWSRSLDSAIALAPEHLSAYNLTYEPGTPLHARKLKGTIAPVDEDTELQMLQLARDRLAHAGYLAYEISNYAKPGRQCRHNLLYWNGGSYLGLGPAAASHLDGLRFRNLPDLPLWEQSILKHAIPATDIESLSPLRRAGELAMLQLRLATGVNYAHFLAQTSFDPRYLWPDLLPRLQQLALIDLDAAGFRLTPKGINVADSVAAEFLIPAPP